MRSTRVGQRGSGRCAAPRSTLAAGAAAAVWLAGCAGGDGDETTEPTLEEYACLHVADGQVIDVALDRAEARTVTVGRDPYRVNLYPDEAGFLKFDPSGAQQLVLLLDHAGAVPAVWQGDERVELEPGAADPFCEEDLPEVLDVPVGSGEHWLEVGPAFQGNIWLMLAAP